MTNLTDLNERELEQSLEERPEIGMTEAPMSTHVDAYYKGFHVGFTVRSEKNDTIPAAKTAAVIEQLIVHGYKPSWNEGTNTAHTTKIPDLSINGDKGQGGTCPVHGTELIFKTGVYKTDRLEKPTHKAGDMYAFWSCPTLNADGSYCKAASQRK